MEDQVKAIRENAQLAVTELGPLSGIDFGFNSASVVWVEGYIERIRTAPGVDATSAGGLVSVLGSFLGECIISAAGGAWQWSESEQSWGIAFSDNTFAFPIAKVRKVFDNGLAGGDSIVSFYEIAVDYLATGRLSQPSPNGVHYVE
jgi:hypothetical protein